MKESNEINVEIIKAALEVITDKLDVVAAVAATEPKVGEMILRHKEVERAKEQLTEGNFSAVFEDLKKIAPQAVDVKFITDGSGNSLPKVDKKEFIHKRGIFDQEGDKR